MNIVSKSKSHLMLVCFTPVEKILLICYIIYLRFLNLKVLAMTLEIIYVSSKTSIENAKTRIDNVEFVSKK